MYYDRDGKPIDRYQWIKLFENKSYQVVKQTALEDGKVSTVWLGLDHRYFDDGPPLIFETMVFWPPDPDGMRPERSMERYATLKAARSGHARFVREMRERLRALKTVLKRSNLPTDLWKAKRDDAHR